MRKELKHVTKKKKSIKHTHTQTAKKEKKGQKKPINQKNKKNEQNVNSKFLSINNYLKGKWIKFFKQKIYNGWMNK